MDTLYVNPHTENLSRRFYRVGSGIVNNSKEQAEARKKVYELLDRYLPQDSVFYIPADRLQESDTVPEIDEFGEVSEKQRQVAAVNLRAEALKRQIQTASLSSSRRGQELDRTYPLRLLKGEASQNDESELDENELRARLDALAEQRRALANAGLLANGEEEQASVPTPLNEVVRRALTLYVKDSEVKLSVYKKLASRITAFQEILQNRFLNKRMMISPDEGFYFLTDTGIKLNPEQLSSGEQHQVVLFHRLLFTTYSKSLFFLMDEPELSLHVEWQQRFLLDLQRVVAVTPIDIVVATHSPLVIAEHWDWAVGLQGRSSEGIRNPPTSPMSPENVDMMDNDEESKIEGADRGGLL